MKPLLPIALSGMMIVSLTACGTLIYPERNTHNSSKLDLSIVALNAIGTILFFVPGVVGFAVDFITGAIYLPNGQVSYLDEAQRLHYQDRGNISQREINQILSQHSLDFQNINIENWQTKDIQDASQIALLQHQGSLVLNHLL